VARQIWETRKIGLKIVLNQDHRNRNGIPSYLRTSKLSRKGQNFKEPPKFVRACESMGVWRTGQLISHLPTIPQTSSLNSSSIFNRCHSLCKVIVFSPISPLHLCFGKHSQFLPAQHFKFSSIKTSMRRAACNWKLAEVSLDIIYWKAILENRPNLGGEDHILIDGGYKI